MVNRQFVFNTLYIKKSILKTILIRNRTSMLSFTCEQFKIRHHDFFY